MRPRSFHIHFTIMSNSGSATVLESPRDNSAIFDPTFLRHRENSIVSFSASIDSHQPIGRFHISCFTNKDFPNQRFYGVQKEFDYCCNNASHRNLIHVRAIELHCSIPHLSIPDSLELEPRQMNYEYLSEESTTDFLQKESFRQGTGFRSPTRKARSVIAVAGDAIDAAAR